MDGKLDKLPIKRLHVIEETGLIERFPPEAGYEDRFRVGGGEEQAEEAVQGDLRRAMGASEFSVIVDLINTVEANDDVTVASMTQPKSFPDEILSDFAVSAATKLQCFRHLGKYFKQSAKPLEQQMAREARFYGALIRLQQNWKVKRQRAVALASGNESFTIDLFDSSVYDLAGIFQPSPLSTVCVDHDSAGTLAINWPPKSYRSLQFGFLGAYTDDIPMESSKAKTQSSSDADKESVIDDECVKETHSLLREDHQTIFSEQVFDLVNREACNQSLGVTATSIQENYLQLNIAQEICVHIPCPN